MRLRFGVPLLLLVVILFSSAFLAFSIRNKHPIDTDILALLPANQSDPALAAALGRLSQIASSQIAFAIEGGDPAMRAEAAADLTSRLNQTGIFRSTTDDGVALWSWLFSHRTDLLCPADRRLLERGEGSVVTHDALLKWYSPFGISNSKLLQSDPLLLTPRLMSCFVRFAGVRRPEKAIIVSGRIEDSVFRIDVQDKVVGALDGWQKRWSASGLTAFRAGAIFHAAYGAASARIQMSLITLATGAAILIIYFLIFGTIRPALLAVLSIGSCLAVGCSTSLLLFDHIHVMVIVFATALIGMVVDYSTYYLITGVAYPQGSITERRRSIFRPLTIGMVTSVGAFLALIGSPISAFRQIAVLGGVGLFFAWALALYLLPFVEGKWRKQTRFARTVPVYIDRFLTIEPRPRHAIAIFGLITLAAVVAWNKGAVLDDVRSFQKPSTELASEEKQVREVTGFKTPGAFFLVTGKSSDEAISHEEALLDAIEQATDGKTVTSIAASQFSPSRQRGDEQAKLISENLLGPELARLLKQVGKAPGSSYDETAGEAKLPDFIADLRGKTSQEYWSAVPVSAPIAELPATLRSGPNWRLVDPASEYSQLLRHYRWNASIGLVGAAILTGLILVLVYQRISALWMLLPTCLAMIATPCLLSLLGVPYSFFSAMGLFLVVGAGVDYSVFQWEKRGTDSHWTRLGITLAAAMTCTSLGLLGLSSVFPVASFGLTVALGIFLSLILSPLVNLGISSRHRKEHRV
jgi:predicted exporter